MRLKVLAVLVFCCGVLLYQTSINFLIVLALLSVIFDSDLCSMGLGFRRLLIRSGGRLVLLLAPGLALYLALSEAVRFWTRSGYNERYQWMRGPENLAGFASQLRDILAHYKHFLLPFHPMLPAFSALLCFLQCSLLVSCLPTGRLVIRLAFLEFRRLQFWCFCLCLIFRFGRQICPCLAHFWVMAIVTPTQWFLCLP